jgi:hypothetical protein
MTALVLSSPFSSVRFVEECRERRPYFAYFGVRGAEFLCSHDLLAEGGVGSELLSAQIPC